MFNISHALLIAGIATVLWICFDITVTLWYERTYDSEDKFQLSNMFKLLFTFISTTVSVMIVDSLSIQHEISAASRIEIPKFTPDEYFVLMRQCSTRFLQDRDGKAAVNSTVRVTYGENLAFTVRFDGRGPALALPSQGERQKIVLSVRVSRDFFNPDIVVADITSVDAVQTPWPDNTQEVDDSKFGPFQPEQQNLLDQFVGDYSTIAFKECMDVKAVTGPHFIRTGSSNDHPKWGLQERSSVR